MDKITVVKEFTFDAAHYLPGYEGPCGNMHGHTYKLLVGFQGEIYANGMVVDFSELKKVIKAHIALLDHSVLNDIFINGFPQYMPTAENMVLWLVKTIPDIQGAVLSFIRLYETPTSYAEWRLS